LVLALAPAGVAAALLADFHAGTVVIGGLVLFGLLFALNSALHSFLILTFRHFPRAATAEGIRAKLAHPPEIVCYALQGEILPCEQQPPAG
jgi:hypothetical protein